MRALVWRYMSAKHRESEKNLVTEDHLQEIKSDISCLKSQLLDTLEKYAAASTSVSASASAYEGKTLFKRAESAASLSSKLPPSSI